MNLIRTVKYVVLFNNRVAYQPRSYCPSSQVALADAARRVSLSDEEVQAANRRLMELQAASETERQRQSERQVAHLQVGGGEIL